MRESRFIIQRVYRQLRTLVAVALLVAVTMLSTPLRGQTLRDYEFSTGVDASKWITTSDWTYIFNSNFTNTASLVTNIGFPFPFGDSTYTQFSVSTHGTFRLGPERTASTYTQAGMFNSAYYNRNQPRITGVARSGNGLSTGSNGYIRYALTGTAPARVFVCEYRMARVGNTGINADVMWQVQLYETTCEVAIVYGSTTPANCPQDFQTGLATSATDIVLLPPDTYTPVYSTTYTNTTYNTWHGTNRYYSFTLPSSTCPRPESIAVSDIGTSSLTATWVDNGSATQWEVRLDCRNVQGSPVVVNTPTYTFTGLTNGTDYSVRVRGICGPGDTTAVRSRSVQTLCGYLPLPYSEGFEDALGTSSDHYGSGSGLQNNLPNCWDYHNEGSSHSFYPCVRIGSGHSGLNYMRCYVDLNSNWSSQYAFLPLTDSIIHPVNSLELSYWIRRENSTHPSTCIVGITPDPTDISTFIPVDTIIRNNDGWIQRTVHFNNYTGPHGRITMLFPKQTGSPAHPNWTFIDDIYLFSHNSFDTVTHIACNSYTWPENSTTYTNSGNYNHTLPNATGYDSIITLQLTIYHSYAGDTTAVVCDSITWRGNYYSESGNYIDTIFLSPLVGCDSTATLHLTVNHRSGLPAILPGATESHFSVSSTQTVQFSKGNLQYQASTGMWRFAEHQYDYIGDDNTHISSTYDGWIDLFGWGTSGWNSGATEYQPYSSFANSNRYQPGGDASNDLTGSYAEADWGWHNAIQNGGNRNHLWRTLIHTEWEYLFNTRTTNTNLGTPNARYAKASVNGTKGVILFPDEYTHPANVAVPLGINATDNTGWDGNTYSTTDWDKMDSAGAVFLPAARMRNGTALTNIGLLGGYYWAADRYNDNNSHAHMLKFNNTSFDPSHHNYRYLGISVRPVHNTEPIIPNDTVAEACNSFTWWNTNYTNSTNTPTHLYSTTAGCDSLVTLHLTINHSTTGDTTATACDSFTWWGTTYTSSTNTATHTFTNAAGCDSVVTLHLTIKNSTTGDTTVTTCNSFSWWNTNYTNSTNSATHTFTNAAGCDSVVTLHLTINYSNTGDTSVTACNSFTWWGNSYTSSTNSATHTFTNAAGCDSVVTLHLTINHSNTGDTNATACNSFTWWNTNYTNSTNSATHTFTNVAGCDSVVTLHLTIKNSTTGDTTVTTCNSFSWWNTNYTNSTNSATHTFTNAADCDSVVTLHLTVNHSTTGDTTATACNSFTWWGNSYTNSTNAATHTFTNAAGCDSVVTLHLTIKNSTTGDTTVTTCNSFTWWDNSFTSSTNTATHTFTNAVGCDSVVTLHLTINHPTTGDTTVTACDSFTWWGTPYSTTGNYVRTWPSALPGGCDSTVTMHLTVNYSNTGIEDTTVCNSFIWHGTEYTTSTNTPTFTCLNAAGCDSVTTLHLTVNHCSTTPITVCDSYTWRGHTYTASGIYVDGTDTLNLTVNHSNTGDTTVTACDSFTWWGNNYTSSTNTATHTFTNAAGCDSVVTLHLTINHPTTGDTTVTACDSFTWWGTPYSTTGNYMRTWPSAFPGGCDSTVTLHLTVNNSSTGSILAYIYADSIPYTVNGINYYSSGQYTQNLTNVHGCDSVLSISLTIISHTNNDIVSSFLGTHVIISPTLNDSLSCNNPTIAIVSPPLLGTTGPQNGGPQNSGSGSTVPTITYTPNSIGLDSLQIVVTCDGHNDTSWIYIVIAPRPDNIVNADCSFPPDSNIFNMVEKYNCPGVNSMTTPMVADMDGDGFPEIIACNNTYNSPWFSSNLLVFDGRTGALKKTIITPEYVTHGQCISIADVDNDGQAEIFLLDRSGKVMCYNYSGERRWLSSGTVSYNFLLSVADIMGDGTPELVCGDHIYNAVDGTLLLEGTTSETGRGFAVPHGYNATYHIPYYMYALADIDNDGTLELCAGNTIYKINITNHSGTTGNSWATLRQAENNAAITNYDGQTFITDFDDDGDMDICVIGTTHEIGHIYPQTSHTLFPYVWDGQTGEIIAYSSLHVVNQHGSSIPFSGDLDGNGTPEIVFSVCDMAMYVYTFDNSQPGNMRLMHSHAPFGETSGFTVFDFNQDGHNEIVYRGTTNMFIVDGTTLDTLCTPITSYSGTIAEYPVVADVDGDGHAEIIVARAYNPWPGANSIGYISVYGSSTPGAWSSARKVWNQWAYSAVNINENLTVPRYRLNVAHRFHNGKKPFNAFLHQVPYLDLNGNMFNPVADIVADSVSGQLVGDSIELTIHYQNQGDIALQAPFGITVYRNSYRNTVLWTDTVRNDIDADSIASHITKIPKAMVCGLIESDSLVIALNDMGIGIAQHGNQQPECDTTNNTVKIATPVYHSTGDTTAVACDSFSWWNTNYTNSTNSATHTFTNAAGCDSVVTLHLTVNHSTTGDTTAMACNSFTWYGTTYSATGDYVRTWQSTLPGGCDSTVTLHLTVNPIATLTHTPDTTILIGESITLHVSNIDNVTWYDSDGNILSISDSLVVSPISLTTYYISGFNHDTSIAINGDFEAGNVHFTSGYTYSSNLVPEGKYYVGPNAHNYHTGFPNWPDHTTGNGNYMIINGTTSNGITVWSQTVPVVPNTEYDFSAWVCNVSLGNPSNVAYLQFSINGVQLGNIFHCPTSLYTWEQFYEVWNSGENTSATISILNLNTTSSGNDFGIDDISFSALTTCIGYDSIHVNVQSKSNTYIDICDNELPYSWNGNTFTSGGVYDVLIPRPAGIDSIATLHLTVKYSTTGDTTAVVCDSISWWNTNYTNSTNSATHTFTNAVGCDSVVTLHLTVNQSTIGDTTATACNSFTWWGTPYSTTGDYVRTWPSAFPGGCDSTVTLHLTVNHSTTGDTTATACDSFTWYGTTYSATGDYVRTWSSVLPGGCDSTVTLHLTVNPMTVLAHTPDTFITAGDTITLWATGATWLTWTDSNGAQLSNTGYLSVHPTVSTSYYVSSFSEGPNLVYNGDFELGNTGFTNDYIYGNTGSYGHYHVGYDIAEMWPWDSPGFAVHDHTSNSGLFLMIDGALQPMTRVWSQTVEVTPHTDYLFSSWVLTDNAGYFKYEINGVQTGFDYVTPDTRWEWKRYSQVWNSDTCTHATLSIVNRFSQSAGYDYCIDDITFSPLTSCSVTDTVTVNIYTYTNYDSSICADMLPFVWYNNNLYSSGIYTDTINAGGNDTIVTLTLSVNPVYHDTIIDTICNNGSRLFEGVSYTTAGLYTVPLHTTAGCDSIRSLNLTVNAAYSADTTAVVCDSIIWNGVWRTANGDYSYTTTTASGCDSTATLHLTVKHSTTGDTTVTACDSMFWNVGWKTVNGDYSYNYTNAVGCDSTVTLHLTLNHASDSTLTVTVVENLLPYTINGLSFSNDTSLLFILPNAMNCDSLIHFSLITIPNSVTVLDTSICETLLPFTWNDSVFYSSGTKQHTTLSHLGSDSTVVMNVTVINTAISTVYDSVIENNLPYSFMGNLYTTDTVGDTMHFVGYTGCDSIVVFNLHVHRNVTALVDSTICSSHLPLTWNGVTFTLAGVQTVTLTASTGADSVLTMVLNVIPGYMIKDTVDICPDGLPLTWHDTTFAAGTTSGLYTKNYHTLAGCDSICLLQLNVHPTYQQNEVLEICNSSLPYTWFDTTFQTGTTTSDHSLHLTSFYGCDSTMSLHLVVNQDYSTSETLALCDNLLPYTWHDTVLDIGSTSGVYTINPHSSHGCDSIMTLTLTVNPTNSSQDIQEQCDSFTWIDGITYYESTTQPSTTSLNHFGCDSVVSLNLTIHHSASTVDSVTSCIAYVWIDGNTYTNSTDSPTITLQTINGCDSVVTLNLEMLQASYTNITDSFCTGTQYLFGTHILTEGGAYTDTLTAYNTCDSIVSLDLTKLSIPTINIEQIVDCSTQSHQIHVETDVNYVFWTCNGSDWNNNWGSENSRNLTINTSKPITLTLLVDYNDNPTCFNTAEVTLQPIIQPHAVMTVSPEFLTYETPTLVAISQSTNANSIQWYIDDNEAGSDQSITYTPPSGYDSVVVTLVAFNGECRDTAIKTIPVKQQTLYVPNAFTPNESTNNTFSILYDGVIEYELNIYNRQGTLLFHSNTNGEPWDGRLNGTPCPQGSYVWIVKYRSEVDPSNWHYAKGTVTLLY